MNVKFAAATSAATAVFRKSSCVSVVPLTRRSTDVHPAGAQMTVLLRAVTCAIIWSLTESAAGFGITSVVADAFAALAVSVSPSVAGSIT